MGGPDSPRGGPCPALFTWRNILPPVALYDSTHTALGSAGFGWSLGSMIRGELGVLALCINALQFLPSGKVFDWVFFQLCGDHHTVPRLAAIRDLVS